LTRTCGALAAGNAILISKFLKVIQYYLPSVERMFRYCSGADLNSTASIKQPKAERLAKKLHGKKNVGFWKLSGALEY
jgi:hypothetical protein